VTTSPAAPTAHRAALFGGLRDVRSADLPREAMAGITLAALMIPLNIGYAQVAGLPPVVGLYTAILPMVAFGLLSSSHHLVAGPDAPIAALIGARLGALAATTDPAYVQLGYAQAIVCGLVFVGFWWFRLGFLANFLSKAVMVGFVSGLGIEVFTSQLQKILGVSVEGDGYFRELLALIQAVPQTNLYAFCIGAGTIVVIRLLKRFTPAVPGALVALILSTVIVAAFGLDKLGVSVLGPVPSGLPTPTIPHGVPLTSWLALFPGALAICGVTLADGLLVGRRYAQKYGDGIDADQELLAFGVAGLASGLSGGFAIGSSASRTAALDGVGARSQVPSLVGAGVVALVLVFFSGLLALLPNAALGGIVANAVLSLIEVDELRSLYRLRRSEFAIAGVCLLSVLVLGSLQAVIIAFLLSAVDLVRRVASPATAVLSPLPGGEGFHVDQGAHQGLSLPGLIVYRFGGPLFFGNASTFQDELQNLVEHAPGTHGTPVHWVVLDASAITDVDSTGADALEQTIESLHKANVTVAVARAAPPLPHVLDTYALTDRIGKDHFFETDRDAVHAFEQATGHVVDPTHVADLEPST
jgi:sulfate permease, SulP family